MEINKNTKNDRFELRINKNTKHDFMTICNEQNLNASKLLIDFIENFIKNNYNNNI